MVCGSNATILPSRRVPFVRKTVRMVPSSRHLARRGSWAGWALPLFRVALPLLVFAFGSIQDRWDRLHPFRSTSLVNIRPTTYKSPAQNLPPGALCPRTHRKRMSHTGAIMTNFMPQMQARQCVRQHASTKCGAANGCATPTMYRAAPHVAARPHNKMRHHRTGLARSKRGGA